MLEGLSPGTPQSWRENSLSYYVSEGLQNLQTSLKVVPVTPLTLASTSFLPFLWSPKLTPLDTHLENTDS